MQMQQLGNTLPVWQPDLFTVQILDSLPSGQGALDEALGGGIPKGALTEIIGDPSGAMRLLLQAVTELSHSDRWVTLIAPPHLPYAPALQACGINLSQLRFVHPENAEARFSCMERALETGTSGIVIAWADGLSEHQLQHLQTLAETGNTTMVVIYTRPTCTWETPAALRLNLEVADDGAKIDILKRRDGWPTGPIRVRWSSPLGTSPQRAVFGYA